MSTDSTTDTVTELPKAMRDPMRKRANKGLMVAWINAQLMDRMSHDVRKSIVLYDATGLFEFALPAEFDLTDEIKTKLYAGTAVRYWSRGI
jgi:hypothetical protein